MFQDKLKKPVEINCGVIAFTVRGGIAAADPILIDTKKNVMLGRGGFSFRSEAIDMAVRADGKTFSLFSGQSPIGVAGYFAAPTVDPISVELASRAGAGLGPIGRESCRERVCQYVEISVVAVPSPKTNPTRMILT